MTQHYSVLLEEALDLLNIRPAGTYLDATAGMGGHTKAIASRLSEAGTVIASDRDPQSLDMARANTAEYWDRIEFQHAAFSELKQTNLDGMLADLGVSRFHLTDAERGFSFMSDGPLDMRLDQTRGITAADLVNHSAEKQIADWLHQLGEERRARKITGALIRGRPVRSTRHLADIVERAVPRSGPIHPATRTFMALRMVVNQEMEELDALLAKAPQMVRPGGRIVIISFHSLEDRKVKNSFRELARTGRAVLLTKKPVVPGEREVRENPPSRSAKCRAVEMISEAVGEQPSSGSADFGESDNED
jgi:16S rRNA (cytosine1402-N4)-methyltransferase